MIRARGRALAWAAALWAAAASSAWAGTTRPLALGSPSAPLSAPALRPPAFAAPGLLAPALARPPGPPTGAVFLDASEARAVAAEALAQAPGVPAAAPLAAFAERDGLGLALIPFAGKARLGLDPDNLGQYVQDRRRVYVNWDYVGGDRRALEDAGLSPDEARALTSLSILPVLAHEWRHAELRSAFGSDFPSLAEEEILTHQDQAATLADMRRARPEFAARAALLEPLFLDSHTRRFVVLRGSGLGVFARYILRRYRDISPTLDDPVQNAVIARASLARLESGLAAAPRGWIAKARANVAFWENLAEVRRLTLFLQSRIDAADAAWNRRP